MRRAGARCESRKRGRPRENETPIARDSHFLLASLSLICSPKNTQKITPVLQARCFVSLGKRFSRKVSARSALGKSTNYCNIYCVSGLLRNIAYQEKVDHLAKHLIK